jgi:hypothetical protein
MTGFELSFSGFGPETFSINLDYGYAPPTALANYSQWHPSNV